MTTILTQGDVLYSASKDRKDTVDFEVGVSVEAEIWNGTKAGHIWWETFRHKGESISEVKAIKKIRINFNDPVFMVDLKR